MNIAAQHYHGRPTSIQQAATSHGRASVDADSKLSDNGEAGPQTSDRLQPDQQDQRRHTRQSQSNLKSSEHQISQFKLGRRPDAGNSDISNHQTGSNSQHASSSSTDSNVSTATVIIADTLSLPHPDHTFDFAICIAVIHHLSTRERRVQAISAVVSKLRTKPRVRSSEEGRTIRQREGKALGRNPDRKDAGEDRRPGKSNLSWGEQSPNGDEQHEEQRRKSEFGSSAAIDDCVNSDAQPGQVLVFVWALEQKSSRRGFDTGDSQNQLVPWVLKPGRNAGSTKQRRSRPTKASASAKTNTEGQCCGESEAEPRNDDGRDRTMVDDAITTGTSQDIRQGTKEEVLEEKTFHRFYHLYQAGELESECAEADARVVERGYDRDNWWVIVEPGNEAEG